MAVQVIMIGQQLLLEYNLIKMSLESKNPKIYMQLAEDLCKIKCDSNKTKQIVEGCQEMNSVEELEKV